MPNVFEFDLTSKRLAILFNFSTKFNYVLPFLKQLGFGFIHFDYHKVTESNINTKLEKNEQIDWTKIDSVLFIFSPTDVNKKKLKYKYLAIIKQFHPNLFKQLKGKTKLFFVPNDVAAYPAKAYEDLVIINGNASVPQDVLWKTFSDIICDLKQDGIEISKFINEFNCKLISRTNSQCLFGIIFFQTTPYYLKKVYYNSTVDDWFLRDRLAIILNNVEFKSHLSTRFGSECDVNGLASLLPNIHYDYIVFNDPSVELVANLGSILTNTKNIKWNQLTSISFFILTHGTSTNLYANDGSYKLSILVDQFHPKQFKILAGKPKMFFISACRGNDLAQTVSSTSGAFDSAEFQFNIEVTPTDLFYKDLVFIYGTTPNNYSLRDPARGTLFIQEFIHTLKSLKKTETIEISDMFRIMNNNLIRREIIVNDKSCKQIAEMINALKKPFSFKRASSEYDNYNRCLKGKKTNWMWKP